MNEPFIIQRKISEEAWRKYKLLQYLIDWKEKEVKARFEYMIQPAFFPDLEPICSHFGCGKKLSSQESLFSDRCISHQSKPSFTSLIEEYISA